MIESSKVVGASHSRRGDGLTVDFGFSTVGNLTSITEPAGAVPADVTLTHAPFGRLTGFLDAQTAAPKYPRNVRRR